MICISCKEDKQKDCFYSNRKLTDGSVYSECIQCMKARNMARMMRNKVIAVQYKGGKCELCGYNKNIKALDFHHIDPTQKDFNISKQKNSNLERLKPELDKCLLLCSNCHREIHDDEYKKTGNINWTLYEDILVNGTKFSHKVISVYFCQNHCGTKISKDSKYCIACFSILRTDPQSGLATPTKIQWPSKEELEKLVWEVPRLQLVKQLGVSDVAIAKHCKHLAISQPPRGYWAKIRAKAQKSID